MITNGEWKVRIDRKPWDDTLDFWLIKLDGNRIVSLGPDGMMTMWPEGALKPESAKPCLQMRGFDAKQMMKALMDALSEEGIHTPDSLKLQGQLDAQGKHLEDLRSLLKLK